MDTFDKGTLRNRGKKALQALSEEHKKSASCSICKHLHAYLKSLDPFPSALLAFIPLPDEPDIRPFYREVCSLYPHLPIGFPRVEGEELAFYRWASSYLPEEGRAKDTEKDPAFYRCPSQTFPASAEEGVHTASGWGIGSYGILEPSPSLPRFGKDIPWGRSPLILVPGRVFDRQGGRIGRGKGYYDRFLRSLRLKGFEGLSVGICFSVQVVERLPITQQDESVDCIITEEGVL